jgi:hypothetical protein
VSKEKRYAHKGRKTYKHIKHGKHTISGLAANRCYSILESQGGGIMDKTSTQVYPIRTAYVGGPVDLANKAVIAKRELIHRELANHGVTVYKPYGAFSYGGNGEIFMKEVNEFAIAHADLVLLIFAKDQVTIGTPIELQYEHDHNKLLVVVSPWEQTPCYIKALSNWTFKTEAEALKFIAGAMYNGKSCEGRSDRY